MRPLSGSPSTGTASHRDMRDTPIVRLLLSAVLATVMLACTHSLAAPVDETEAFTSILEDLGSLQENPESLEKVRAWVELERVRTEAEYQAASAELQKATLEHARLKTEVAAQERRQEALQSAQNLLLRLSGTAQSGGLVSSPRWTRDIRPILSDNCFACHGPDQGKRKAGLRLDDGKTLYQKLKSGRTAVIPGDRGGSELYARLIAADADDRMPPESTHKVLSPEQIEKIGQWIDGGAEYEEHWAFMPLSRPDIPQPDRPAWNQNPIDAFVLQNLEKARLEPNPEADRGTLIRRASFDLVGLPPTPEQIEAFVNDPSPTAYEDLIDRLLESPHFGETWARHWLDIARFAESNGYEQDYDREYAYHYRDFVIEAFNRDLPYDTFVKWQIAGDEYEPDNPLALMATGFLGAGVHATQITKSQVEKERYDELDDMLRTIGTSMLGLTFGCAKCHDHKFDPIPAHDYYRMLSTFTTVVRSELELDMGPEAYQRELARFDRKHEPLLQDLTRYEKETLEPKFEAWLSEQDPEQIAQVWRIPDNQVASSARGASMTLDEEGVWMVGGATPELDVYEWVGTTSLANLTGLRLDVLADDSLSQKGPGRAENGNFALSHLTVEVLPASATATVGMPVSLTDATATVEQEGLLAAYAIDSDTASAWAVGPGIGKDQSARFGFSEPVGFGGGTRVRVRLHFEHSPHHSLGRFRLSVTGRKEKPTLSQEVRPELVVLALSGMDERPDGGLSQPDRSEVFQWFRARDGEVKDKVKKIKENAEKRPHPDAIKVQVCSEGVTAVRYHTQGGDYLEHTHFLTRGDPNQKGDIATQGFLALLTRNPEGESHWQESPPPEWRTSYRRRSFANWITDVEEGPGFLLARVVVNRLWQHHFGAGIVSTPSDFGYQGAPPTHPELLDWLASELIAGGWRLKPLHKLMMTSATYRQSSAFSEAKSKNDPENHLLWRYRSHRLPAEIIRDAMLKVSGDLDATLYGPGTLDPGMNRRSLYFTVKRSKLIPMMIQFDGPDSLQGMAQRPVTTTPPQSLLLMNNARVRDWAESFEKRLAAKGANTPDSLVRAGYLEALGREPSEGELQDSLAYLSAQKTSYQETGSPEADTTSRVDFCQILFCLNEFVYVH